MADYRVNLTLLFVEVKIQSKFNCQISPREDKTVWNGSVGLKTGDKLPALVNKTVKPSDSTKGNEFD